MPMHHRWICPCARRTSWAMARSTLRRHRALPPRRELKPLSSERAAPWSAATAPLQRPRGLLPTRPNSMTLPLPSAIAGLLHRVRQVLTDFVAKSGRRIAGAPRRMSVRPGWLQQGRRLEALLPTRASQLRQAFSALSFCSDLGSSPFVASRSHDHHSNASAPEAAGERGRRSMGRGQGCNEPGRVWRPSSAAT